MEQLIKKLPNELQSKIFLYNSYVPFKKIELNYYVSNIKAVYFKSNDDLIFIHKIQYDGINKQLLKIYNNNLNKICRICHCIIKHTITDDIYCYMLDDINNTYINKRFIYHLKYRFKYINN